MRILSTALTLALGLVIAGCSSSTPTTNSPPSTSGLTTTSAAPVPTTTTTSAPPSTTTTVPDATPNNEDVFDAVEAFWDMYVELGGLTDDFDPTALRERLEQHTTAAEMEQLFGYFQSNSLAGYEIRGDIESSLTVVERSQTEAEVRDCYDDTTGLYDIETGERLDEDSPAHHQVVLSLVFEDEVWKVAAIRDEGDGCTAS